MIALLWLIGYLVFGFALIGFLAARYDSMGWLSAVQYIGTSIIWPCFLLWLFFMSLDDLGDVRPYLRKVFGGPKKN